MLHHALGLALVRTKHGDEALRELERAATLEPGNARFVYVCAVALHSTGKSAAAIASLEKVLVTHPNDRDVLETLASFHNECGEITEAKNMQGGCVRSWRTTSRRKLRRSG
jgi:Flp pilus assembly protein TadD